jgi:hypothetical protein
MSDNTLDKIAIYFALEHDFDADLARRYCKLIVESDMKSLEGLNIFRNDGVRKEFWHACYRLDFPDSQKSPDFWRDETRLIEFHNLLVSRLKRERLIR